MWFEKALQQAVPMYLVSVGSRHYRPSYTVHIQDRYDPFLSSVKRSVSTSDDFKQLSSALTAIRQRGDGQAQRCM